MSATYIAVAVALACSGTLSGGPLAVGSGGNGAVQLISSSGDPLGSVGPDGATAGAFGPSGGMLFAVPGDSDTTIYRYDASRTFLGSFVFVAPSDNRDYSSYIVDLTWGLLDSLWASSYTGVIYQLSAAGAVLGSFDTGYTSPGIATDGSSLYTTSGLGESVVHRRNAAGGVLATIDTSLFDTLGIGVDASDQTLWIGGSDSIAHLDSSGNIMGAYALDGFHSGVEFENGFSAAASVPEPSTFWLMMAGAGALFSRRVRRFIRPATPLPFVCAAVLAGSAAAAVSISSITPSPASPRPVGTVVSVTAAASDPEDGAVLRYRFRVRPAGGTFSMVRDFSPSATLNWAPADTDGTFEIEVTAKNRTNGTTATDSITYQVTPRASGNTAAVTAAAHPMVALYSAPPCALGSTVRVRFKLPADVLWQSTDTRPCRGTATVNFYIGGMLASTTYQMRHDVMTGPRVTSGPVLNFTTGAMVITIPATTFPDPLDPPTSVNQGITMFAPLVSGKPAFAVDAAGRVIWYSWVSSPYMTRPAPGGTVLLLFGYTKTLSTSGFREIDLAGNVLKETNVECINDQLTAQGKPTITVVHHEARRLANGNYLVLAQTERLRDDQGAGLDIVGDMILVLDSNLQVLWSWDPFDHLDVSRKAVLNETCGNGVAACVLLLATRANDWTHSNSVALTPDGHLLLSARHQDRVYKIHYANGTGDGHVIWTLGKDGDFSWNSGDPYPWFSHQHDAEFESANTISLFDNGNTRFSQVGGNSRGQVLSIDEGQKAITLLVNTDLGVRATALGSAQRLSNGNYHFHSGNVSESVETSPTGTITARTRTVQTTYRSFRLRDLYSAPF